MNTNNVILSPSLVILSETKDLEVAQDKLREEAFFSGDLRSFTPFRMTAWVCFSRACYITVTVISLTFPSSIENPLATGFARSIRVTMTYTASG